MTESRHPVRVCIAQPVVGHITYAAHQSQLIALHHAWVNGTIAGFSFVGDTYLDRARNTCVSQAQALDATHIFWIDSDMVIPENTVADLLAHNRRIVGGLYHRRRSPYEPVAWTVDAEGHNMTLLPEVKEGGLQRVDGIGTGCLLTAMDVFEEIPFPWFAATTIDEAGVKCFIGEDVHFAMECWRRKIPFWLDTDVKCGHVTDVAITYGDWLAHKDEDQAGPCPEAP